MNYDEIKAMAKAERCKVTDLIALAPQNDPFYVGSEGTRAGAEWFATLYTKFGYRQGVHLRRVHYQIVSQDPPVAMPNGKTYENTDNCWKYLGQASKWARYLHLVNADDFDDKRNPDPIDCEVWRDTDTRLSVRADDDYFTAELRDFPDLPAYDLIGYNATQRYHLEIWCEKSTMNDILEPLARRYGATLQIGVGELSITKTLSLVKRIDSADRPARIFYISDFDPAGKSMPVAVARKLEFLIEDEELDLDVRLFPLVLTEEQCKLFQLPRTPIKETEVRAGRFQEQYGEGATELDALEALRPGELRRIVEQAIRHYYDSSLDSRVADERSELHAELDRRVRLVISAYQEQIDQLEVDYDDIRALVTERLEAWDARRQRVWQGISADLEASAPDLDDYPVPEADEGREFDSGLFNTTRSYFEQIAAYKMFQGKEAA